MGSIEERLLEAAAVVAGAGLVDAFGHISIRDGDELLITAPVPLAFQTPEQLVRIRIDCSELPLGAPKEAWIHLAIARAHPATGAVCRAQPRAVAKAVAARRALRPLDGQGALLGPHVPVHADSRLIRDRVSADAVVDALHDAPAVVLYGNGAVTHGADAAAAVARMWLLERSAELTLAAPEETELPADQQAWWRERDSELLPRIYEHLVRTHAASG
ncbi:hypothetical protein GCM10025768_26680 [Microbacterium pseudoresistens]|uniref:HCOMODA/2-hydroxy-3-carboxy-muconic semialdehyde decarboxylase n=1 Tax=Microbacterium pseudoresistens TaxID=640634 RepID=A0A7Y9JM90_9MICO|nr:class II aldolase/adducin family protein [Microbacterium pseudoresistens]NYD53781.1 HCOMODA/2-hydroxy-3-carboxy-muconic semialdehyde decarboxylase [Microbacterium pseudoresistens]